MAKAKKKPETAEVLSPRALNRATLARQLLLARAPLTPVAAVQRLMGLQAQQPRPPFVGLWTRIAGFARADLVEALEDRTIVRVTAMRCTLHLMSAQDYQHLRGALKPVLDGAMAAIHKAIQKQRRGEVPEVAALVEAAREALDDSPHTFEAVRELLVARFPGMDERAMGFAVRTQLPLVQVPTAAPWAFPSNPAFLASEAWLGSAPDPADHVQELVRRYLAAFGPASVADMQTWSGLRGLKPAFEALRPGLVAFKDARGRELFDLPDAPRPAEDTPAPVRLLPEFDNLVLGHDDRSRVIADAHRKVVVTPNLQVLATFLVDGVVAGTWKVAATRTQATLTLTPFEPLGAPARDALAAEADSLLAFLAPEVKLATVAFA